MIAFPAMLANPAVEAGMKVPENQEDFDKEEYPHFYVYLEMQLGAPMPSATSHHTNAKLIAGLTMDEVQTITPKELIARGFEC